jgi:hypothetical protein
MGAGYQSEFAPGVEKTLIGLKFRKQKEKCLGSKEKKLRGFHHIKITFFIDNKF